MASREASSPRQCAGSQPRSSYQVRQRDGPRRKRDRRYTRRCRSERGQMANKRRPAKPFVYDPAIDPFLIEGGRWRVGANFELVALRFHDRSLRLTPMSDEQLSRAFAEIRERQDEIAAHSLQSTAFVLGLLLYHGAIDPMHAMAGIRELLERAANDEERESRTRILEGRATQADREAAMKSMEAGR